MAFGDPTLRTLPIPWEEFGYAEYLCRLEDLLKERHRVFAQAVRHRSPSGTASDADAEYHRLGKALEQTALQFAAYVARLRLEAS